MKFKNKRTGNVVVVSNEATVKLMQASSRYEAIAEKPPKPPKPPKNGKDPKDITGEDTGGKDPSAE